MVIISNGTVFNTDAKAIVNTVNCKGVMGAGIALEFQLRYPKMYEDYKSKCENGDIRIGEVDYYDSGENTIINFPTKYDFKFPSRLEWVEAGLKNFVETYERHNIESVAFPKLGAGRGGLDWGGVKNLMLEYLEPLDIKVYICEDSLSYPEGIEKEMLDKLNTISMQLLAKDNRLNEKQIASIEKSRPLKRFWQLERIDSIGPTTYERLFGYFYDICKGNRFEQLSLM